MRQEEFMPSHTTNRWSAWAGFAFVALAVVGYILGPADLPDTSGNNGLQKLSAYFANDNNQTRDVISAILLVFAVFAFLWFLGGLRARLRSVETDVSPISNLVMGCGVAFAVLFGAAGLFFNAVGGELKFDDAYKLDANNALLTISGGYAFLVLAMIAMSVLLFASWALSRRTRVLPPWAAWVGFVFAIAGLGIWFTAWFMPLAVALWVLLVSLAMLGVGARQDTTVRATPPAP
jgi:MFS family permease